ncbi:hypothetical protein BDY21DRAFT_371558 [Lineolata rhizophorae]|uniref:Uncharacterized protein n=1 Tax=Lineolata rhizophorae TaxID=578093 RepID=A0A6A6P200_9PEZI|nr:hypothetical protein BDY21DRAFT_371558 [Lineolata rhizophorae]
MWKRIPRGQRGKENQIGNPVLIETTYDEKTLESTPHISAVHDGPASPKQPLRSHPVVDTTTSEQLSLPFRSLAPPDSYSAVNRRSDAPTASSVYSQPTPPTHYGWDPKQPYQDSPQQPEISPPTSPVMMPRPRRSSDSSHHSPDVSPIDEAPELPPQPRKEPSFPTLRAPQIPPNPVRPASSNRTTPRSRPLVPGTGPDGGIRWDAYSGEPTTSADGRPAQVKVGDPNYHPYHSVLRRRDPEGQPDSSKLRSIPVASRAPRFNSTSPPPETQPTREPWRGASGRQTIVDPVRDEPKPNRGPLVSPIRDGRKQIPDTTTIKATSRRPVPLPSGAVKSPTHSKNTSNEDQSIKPVVPLKVGRNSPPRIISSPASPNAPKPYPSPLTPSPLTPRGPRPAVAPSDGSPSNPTENSAPKPKTIPRKSIDTVNAPQVNEPASRFSWTTYATSAADHDSPPPSPPPPLPAMPAVSTAATAAQGLPTRHTPPPDDTILNRRRPVPSRVVSDVHTPSEVIPFQGLPSRKPVGSSPSTPRASEPPRRAASMATTRPSTTKPASTLGGKEGKALPLSPPELESQDRITSLQAQLDSVELQRNNVRRLLRDLGRPRNPLQQDLAARREAERTARALEEELAELTQLEHEVGLKLHRAYKRKEQEECAQPTTLWIRRVTE